MIRTRDLVELVNKYLPEPYEIHKEYKAEIVARLQGYDELKEGVKKLLERMGEWIEEKALELNNEILLESYRGNYYKLAKDFIRSLIKEA